MDLFELLPSEFAASSKPPSRDVIVEHRIHERKCMARVRVEPKPCNQGCRQNDAFTLSAMLPTKYLGPGHLLYAMD